ncbi:MAG TPA: EamA family transporter [Chloroflexota bacterium]
MRGIIYILISGALGVTGQLVLKRGLVALGSPALPADGLPGFIAALALNPLIVGGLAVYVLGTLFWLVALSRLDLSYAYPFASLNYVLVLLASWLVLGELPSATRLAGVALICLGVCAIARTTANTRERARPLAAAPVMGGTER